MMKNSIPALILILLTACSTAELNSAMEQIRKSGAGDTLTSSEISNGLKQALEKGSEYAVKNGSGNGSFLNNAKIKIPFPPEVQNIQNTLNSMGLSSVNDQFVATLNHAAETATTEAKPVFVDAIRAMTIADAVSILNGPTDAATQYLKKTTSSKLRDKFLPIVKNATTKVELTRYWTPVMNAYNALPLSDSKANPDLNAYVTQRTLDGLFTLVAEEEAKIRANPVERTTDLLKKVFGSAKVQ